MRKIGNTSNRQEAERFTDYLLTLGIKAEEDEASAIWVHDDDHLDKAREEFERFLEAPDESRYKDAAAAAELLRKRRAKQDRGARKKHVDVRQHWDRPIIKQIPATLVLIVLCLLVGFATDFGKKREPVIPKLQIQEVHFEGNEAYGKEMNGEAWRLVTPALIHYGFIHLFFNMYWIYFLGGLMESRRGVIRYIVFILAVASFSNLAQFLFTGNPLFGGMSGVNYGLFGYIWMKSKFDPNSGFYLMPNMVVLFLVFFFLCLTGLVGPIANYAHGGGLLLGVVVGYAPNFWRKIQNN